MMTKKTFLKLLFRSIIPCAAAGVLLTGCDDDKEVTPPEGEFVIDPVKNDVKGVYVLSEGNMGSNKASIDYFDASSGYYVTNIYPSRNPSVALELGDVGNDLKICGDYLYAVINGSGKVEVMKANDAVRVGQIDIANPRYVADYDGFVYVSSYMSGTNGVGSVYKINPETLQIAARVDVGYEPEEMAVANGKLYVANSGGYRAMNGGPYDRTVSVIDLSSFTVTKSIDVDVNLHRLRADNNGHIYVSSRGDYGAIPSSLYVIDSATDEVIKHIDCGVSDMWIHGDKVYLYTVGYDQNWMATYSYRTISLSDLTVSSGSFITDGSDSRIVAPNGIAVNPVTGDIFIADARNYVSAGAVYCYGNDGKLKWTHNSGDIPGHFAFKTR